MANSGGSQRGSGRKPQAHRDWVRSEGLRVSFRLGEIADLRAIAEAWGLPVATTVWAIVHERLATWRKKPIELGPHGLSIVAGLAVTRRTSEMPEADTNAGAQ